MSCSVVCQLTTAGRRATLPAYGGRARVDAAVCEEGFADAPVELVEPFLAHPSRHLLFTVPAGAPPQHLAFDGGFAYITSGYGSLIEKVRADDGRVVARAHAPYGSFDLDAAAGYVVTASLLRGTLAIYDRNLRLLHVRQLAPSTEDLAISQP